MAVVADAEIDSPVGAAPGTRNVRVGRSVGIPAQRSARVRPVRLVRVGDQRRPGHHVVAPRSRQPMACAPRSRGASLGWLVLAGGLTLLIVLGTGWLASSSDGSATVPVPSSTTLISIHSGETLWDVAIQEAPSSPPQAVVDRIRELNNLDDASLYPGEMLRVPVDASLAAH
jgi:hypothetical protein